MIVNWGVAHKLEIVNFENVVAALGFFLFGGLTWFFSSSTKYTRAEPQIKNQLDAKQIHWACTAPHLIVIGLLFVFLLHQLGLHQYSTFLLLLWITLLIWITHIFWTWDRRAQINLALGMDRTDLAWILGLAAVALIIGAYALRDFPAVLIGDEGSFWETARAIATGEYKPPFFDFGVYTFPIASSIFQGWAMRLFGVNVFGWRLSSVLAASATIIPVYLLGREWFDRRVAIIAALVMVANPYYLAYARLGYNNAQALFPAALSIFLWVRAVKRSSLFYCWLAGLMGLIGYYTYISAWLGLLTILFSAVFLLITRKLAMRQLLINGVVLFLAAVVIAGPRLAYNLSSPDKENSTFKLLEASFFNSYYGQAYYSPADLYDVHPPVHIGQFDIFYEPKIYGVFIYRGILRTFVELFNPLILTDHFMTSGFAGTISPIFFLIGFVLALRGWKQIRFGTALLWLFSGLLFLSALNTFPPSSQHAVSTIPIIALFAAFGIVSAADMFTGAMKVSPQLWASRVLMIAATVSILIAGIWQYFITMPKEYSPTFEDIASQITWNYAPPSTIFYIQDSANPSRVAYIVWSKMIPHTYQALDIAGLRNGSFSSDTLQSLIAFFPVDPNGEISARLKQLVPNLSRTATYTDENGQVIGHAVTNTTAQLAAEPTFSEGIQSIFDTPACALILILLIASFLAATWGRHYSWPRLAVNVLKQEINSDKDRSTTEFSVRIRISHKKSKVDQP